MRHYCGIDLHGNNNVISVIDEEDRSVFGKRISNELKSVLSALEPYRNSIEGIVVESTYNWYWLVDGLMDNGYKVHLANPAAIKQYEGLKFTDDKSDARWLAHLLRLGILPTGYIYPKADRPVRDLLRKRGQVPASPTERKRVRATQSAATSIWPGHLSKRPIMRYDTMSRPENSISESLQKD
jgi:transposase